MASKEGSVGGQRKEVNVEIYSKAANLDEY
jgi:hypothetical protein